MQKRVLFSPVKGQLLAGGKPVAKREVVQRWQWLGVDEGETRVVTDADGRFSFPEVSVRKLRAPKDVLLVQDLEVLHQGQKVSLWNLTRQSLGESGAHAELGGTPIELLADLDQQPREVKLPIDPDTLSTVSGVATFRHPYFERWERTRRQVTDEGVAQALKSYLSSEEGAKGLAAFFPAVGQTRRVVSKVVGVSEVKLEDGFLFSGDDGHYAVREAPRFVGFTTRAKVALELDSGEALTVGFFAWKLLLPLDGEGKPKWEARFRDRWEVDARDWVRKQAEALLVPAKAADLVRAQLPLTPGEQLLEAVGAKSGEKRGDKAGTKSRDKTGDPALTVKGVEVSAVKIDGIKDDWAVLNVLGQARLEVSGREERPRFRAFLSVQLASLAGPEYRLSPGKDAPHFRAFPFAVALEMDKKVYAPGEKIVLRFQVENLMGTPQRFLKWHTPFEGFRNDFLDVERVGAGGGGVGEKVEYSGILASRAPPGPEAYLTLKPGEKAKSEIEITEAYPVKAKGEYVLRYKPLDAVWADETRFTVR